MSCLFDSLAPAVNLHSDILRRAIAAYLKTDPELLDNLKASDIIGISDTDNRYHRDQHVGKTLNDYVDTMSRRDIWGGSIEIKAFCELFGVDVVVHILYTGKSITFESSKDPNRIIHINYTGNHFTPNYTTFLKATF